MGIRMGEGSPGTAFSKDILKIEINGPEVGSPVLRFALNTPR